MKWNQLYQSNQLKLIKNGEKTTTNKPEILKYIINWITLTVVCK